jgi:hypothetical protein
MKPDAYLQAVKQQLTAGGNDVYEIDLPSGHAVVGHISQFKWKWFATKLHLLTIALYIPELNIGTYAAAVKEATSYASSQKSTFHGFLVGLAVNVIIATQAIDTETISLASSRPPKEFAKLTTPAVVDLLQAKTYTYSGKVVWGGIYTAWLRQKLAAALPHIEPRTLSQEELELLY